MTTYRIKLRGMYAGPAQSDNARPGPDQEFYEADWVVPVIPVIGDTLILPDGGGGDQDLVVSERVIYPDRSRSGWAATSVAGTRRAWRAYSRAPSTTSPCAG